MKKLKIVTFIILITIVILNVCSVSVFAADPIIDPGFWEPTPDNDRTLNEKIGIILGIIQIIGVIVSVIVLMILGIKYMVGSVEEKAINKKAMIPYLVGAVMVFAVTTVPNFVFNVTDSILNECNHEYFYWPLSAEEVNYNLHHIKWYDCDICGEHEEREYHSWDASGICSLCNIGCDHYYEGGTQKYTNLGDGYHTVKQCVICGSWSKEQHQSWREGESSRSRICEKCGYICEHSVTERGYKKLNDEYHVEVDRCVTCDFEKIDYRTNYEHQLNAEGKCILCED